MKKKKELDVIFIIDKSGIDKLDKAHYLLVSAVLAIGRIF